MNQLLQRMTLNRQWEKGCLREFNYLVYNGPHDNDDNNETVTPTTLSPAHLDTVKDNRKLYFEIKKTEIKIRIFGSKVVEVNSWSIAGVHWF